MSARRLFIVIEGLLGDYDDQDGGILRPNFILFREEIEKYGPEIRISLRIKKPPRLVVV
jgi:hypothetical protein